MKKYELTNETFTLGDGTVLYRIKALKDFSDVKKGDLGGYVETKKNLAQKGNCWIYDEAKVFCLAQVCDNACVRDLAMVCDLAIVSGNADVGHTSCVGETSVINRNMKVQGNCELISKEKYNLTEAFEKYTDYCIVSEFTGLPSEMDDNIENISHSIGEIIETYGGYDINIRSLPEEVIKEFDKYIEEAYEEGREQLRQEEKLYKLREQEEQEEQEEDMSNF